MTDPIPEGYPQVMPYLIVDGAADAIEFYKGMLGASERMRMPGPDGRIGHAELTLGDAVIMLADESPDMGARSPRSVGGSPVTVHVYVDDVDAAFERATAAGATDAAGGRGPLLRRPLGPARRPLRAPLEPGHARRGRLAGGDVAPRRRDDERRLAHAHERRGEALAPAREARRPVELAPRSRVGGALRARHRRTP